MSRQIRFRGWHIESKVMLYPPNPTDSMFDARPHTKIYIRHPISDISLQSHDTIPEVGDKSYSERNIPATMTWDGRLYIEGILQNIVFQQSTGLKDKENKDIFEGDILEVESETQFVGVQKYKTEVRWDELAVSFTGIPESFFGRYHSTRIKSVVIVGNIYENPELLK